MATIARNNNAGVNTTAGSSASWNHTGAGGADNVVFVAFVVVSDGGSSDPGAGTQTVTYDGVAMTPLGSSNQGAGAFHQALFTYYAVNPASGLKAISVSTTATGVFAVMGISVDYTGCAGTVDAAVTGGPTSTTDFSLSTTPAKTNEWVLMFTKNDLGASSAGTNSTQIQSNSNGSALWDSNGVVTQSAAYVMHTTSSSATFNGVQASFPATDSVGGGATNWGPWVAGNNWNRIVQNVR